MTDNGPQPTQDTRKTSVEKLTKARQLADEMAAAAAREPSNAAMQKLAWYSERLNRIIDGDW